MHVEGGEEQAGLFVVGAVVRTLGGVKRALFLQGALAALLGVDGSEQSLGLALNAVVAGESFLRQAAGISVSPIIHFQSRLVEKHTPLVGRGRQRRRRREDGHGRSRRQEGNGRSRQADVRSDRCPPCRLGDAAQVAEALHAAGDRLVVLAERGGQLARLDETILGLLIALHRVTRPRVIDGRGNHLVGGAEQRLDALAGQDRQLPKGEVRVVLFGVEGSAGLLGLRGFLHGLDELGFLLILPGLGEQLASAGLRRFG